MESNKEEGGIVLPDSSITNLLIMGIVTLLLGGWVLFGLTYPKVGVV